MRNSNLPVTNEIAGQTIKRNDVQEEAMYIETIDDEAEFEEDVDVGSFNHGYIQMRLGSLLDQSGKVTPVSELSLDITGIDLATFDLSLKEEIKPDIALYERRSLSRPFDILKMKEMPLVAIEILSPRQGSYDILRKFKLYFALGVRSCWLVDPALATITVYRSMDQHRTFSGGEVYDEPTGIRLPIEDIFS